MIRRSLRSKTTSIITSFGALALLAALGSCSAHIPVDQVPSEGTGGNPGTDSSFGDNLPKCTNTQLQPVANPGTVASEVIPAAYACEIAVDPAGLRVAACSSADPVTVGVTAIPPGQNTEAFVQKRATDGTLIFRTPIAGLAPRAVAAAASGETFVLSPTDPASDQDPGFLLVKLTPTGDIAWKNEFYKMYDGVGAYGALAVASDGTVWVTGSTDFIAAQYDASGNELQRIAMQVGGNDGWGAGQAIRVLDNGDLLVAGVFLSPIDLGGGQLGNAADTLYSGFLVRYTSSGRYVTSQVFSGNTGVQAVGLATGPNGSIVLTGNLNGKPSVFGCTGPDSGVAPGFVAKLNDSLAAEWTSIVPSSVGAPAVDASGNITLPTKSPDNIYLLTLDPTGTTGTTRTTTAGFAASYRVAVSPDGMTYVSGSFIGSVSFGSTPITATSVAGYLLTIEP